MTTKSTTFSVFVDGYGFEHGLVEFDANALKEMLRDFFPGANCVVIQER